MGTIIIAEAGVNHNRSIETAKKLIEKAAEAGADFVKFQTFQADDLVSKKAKKAKYQLLENKDKQDQYSMLKKLEIPLEWYPILINHCKENGIKFLSTGFDEKSIDYLDSLNMSYFKIPSGEINNLPYLTHVAKKGKKIIISTGMSTMVEIRSALDILVHNGVSKENIIVLHCNTQYPTPMEDVNLKAMLSIRDEFEIKVGYSDHTLGIEIPIAAVALGAVMIEKHFTLDNDSKGPDHQASLNPKDLKKMTTCIRNLELALGNGRKIPSKSELENLVVVRKSIHLVNDLKKGQVIKKSNLKMLRPGNGISPMDVEIILGKKAIRNLNKGHKLSYRDLE